MGKSAYQIRMNYQNAVNQAAEIENLARKLRQLSQGNVKNIKGKVGGNWHGRSAEQYGQKLDKFAKSLANTASKVTALSKTVRDMAKTTYNAEMQAEQLARQRVGGGGAL